ncbi:MAG TPA: VWA domain-containing protein, partial [Egibacteraceae bacterium]|nr:VWA domain-containing protein [Egibacteraceae bacterium]
MSLAAPAGLAAALLAVPLVLWYVLRSRRPRAVVSSTFLWARTERSTRAAVPWQRFRPDRTFWLILLAILVGAVALARPAIPVPAQLGDHTILIVDSSGSMLADEQGPSRLELARREAEALVSTMGPGQVASVIEAGQRARVVLSASPDPAAVRDALRSVRPGQATADLADAFTLAAALERPGQGTVVHVFTDGVIPAEAAGTAPEGLAVTAVGQDRDNLAITRLQALPVGAGAAQAFVQVRSFGQRPIDAILTLAVDGAAFVEQPLRLPPRGTEDLVIPVEAATAGEGLLTARIEPLAAVRSDDGTAGDSLALDDTAWAVLAGPRDVTVLIAGPGNLFLESALAS